jgi:hypothetical protein
MGLVISEIQLEDEQGELRTQTVSKVKMESHTDSHVCVAVSSGVKMARSLRSQVAGLV